MTQLGDATRRVLSLWAARSVGSAVAHTLRAMRVREQRARSARATRCATPRASSSTRSSPRRRSCASSASSRRCARVWVFACVCHRVVGSMHSVVPLDLALAGTARLRGEPVLRRRERPVRAVCGRGAAVSSGRTKTADVEEGLYEQSVVGCCCFCAAASASSLTIELHAVDVASSCRFRNARLCSGSRNGDVLHEITSVRSWSVVMSNEIMPSSASWSQARDRVSGVVNTKSSNWFKHTQQHAHHVLVLGFVGCELVADELVVVDRRERGQRRWL